MRERRVRSSNKMLCRGFLVTVLVALSCVDGQQRGRTRSRNRDLEDDLFESASPASRSKTTTTQVPILRQINELLEDGSYRFGYEGGDGSFRIETRLPNGEVRGKYGFRDANGEIKVVEYSANNETGFDAQGDHIPKGPPPARAQPGDNDEDFNEDFTTPRPRRPSKRPRTRPTTQRSRPRPQPVEVPQHVDQQFDHFNQQQHFDQGDQFVDNQPQLVQQDFRQPSRGSGNRNRFREQQQHHQQPVQHLQPQVPARRPSRPRPQQTFGEDDGGFVAPQPVHPPPRASTAVQHTGTGNIVARPVVHHSFGESGGRVSVIDDFLANLPPSPPQPPPQRRPSHQSSNSGSVIDSFLSQLPPPSQQQQQRRPPARRPVVLELDSDDFDDGSNRFRGRSRQPSRNRDNSAVLGQSHGFILQSSVPSRHGGQFNQGGQFEEETKLIQTVPGAQAPFIHTFFKKK